LAYQKNEYAAQARFKSVIPVFGC